MLIIVMVQELERWGEVLSGLSSHLTSLRGKAAHSFVRKIKELRQSGVPEAPSAREKACRVLLDATYLLEQPLVDKEFPQSQNELTNFLFECFRVCLELVPSPAATPQQVELMEAVLWREGALAYMFVETRAESGEMGELALEHNKTLIDHGMGSLKAMRCVRERDTTGSDPLMSAGIYSDTHLLSLAFEGGLCLRMAALQSSKELALRGVAALEEYVRLVRAEPKLCGWDTTRAIELIEANKST